MMIRIDDQITILFWLLGGYSILGIPIVHWAVWKVASHSQRDMGEVKVIQIFHLSRELMASFSIYCRYCSYNLLHYWTSFMTKINRNPPMYGSSGFLVSKAKMVTAARCSFWLEKLHSLCKNLSKVIWFEECLSSSTFTRQEAYLVWKHKSSFACQTYGRKWAIHLCFNWKKCGGG